MTTLNPSKVELKSSEIIKKDGVSETIRPDSRRLSHVLLCKASTVTQRFCTAEQKPHWLFYFLLIEVNRWQQRIKNL